MTLTDALAQVGAVFDGLAARREPVGPGIAYGVIVDGELAHAGGIGTRRDGEDLRPDRDSVFRIASMTKSFTAAAVLLLRDEGRLRLDDAVASWVPELAPSDPPTGDDGPITVRQLLTMSAGLPTDDPWGDRQQALELDRFAALLARGLSFAWAPGTRFEYSNLGYGILGRVVTSAAGIEYRDFVRQRLLEPLGMTATTFEVEDVPDERLARGYVRRGDAWLEQPMDAYGALASMGGLFTSIADLARWVADFLDAFPPRDGPDAHPLARASRREMQQVQRSVEPEVTRASADALPLLSSGGYGYGLGVSDDLRLGRVVGHGGGYPGYGSHMRWHPASGIGVIAFANGRYAPMHEPVREALALLVEGQPARVRRLTPWPETIEARAVIERLLAAWDQDAARAVFAMNVELDEPVSRRAEAFARLREVHGQLRPDPSAAAESDSPAHLSWWMSGERGRVKVEMLLSPERQPLVQKLTVTSVPEPSAALRAVAERLAGLLAMPGPSWPEGIPLAASADLPAIERSLRAAEALFGPVALGPPTAGDGTKQATWRLIGERGDVELQLELEAPDGALSKVGFVPGAQRPPVHAV